MYCSLRVSWNIREDNNQQKGYVNIFLHLKQAIQLCTLLFVMAHISSELLMYCNLLCRAFIGHNLYLCTEWVAVVGGWEMWVWRKSVQRLCFHPLQLFIPISHPALCLRPEGMGSRAALEGSVPVTLRQQLGLLEWSGRHSARCEEIFHEHSICFTIKKIYLNTTTKFSGSVLSTSDSLSAL